MSNQAVVIGSFEDIEPTADALDRLRELGIPDDQISVLSGLPYSPDALGRPHVKTRLPTVSLVSAVLGLLAGIFFTVITPYLYVIRVGGQPIVPVPPTALLLYEFIMLFLIVGTFGGFVVLGGFSARKPQYYDPRLSAGRIALLVHAPDEQKAQVVSILQEHGAQDVHEPERRQL